MGVKSLGQLVDRFGKASFFNAGAYSVVINIRSGLRHIFRNGHIHQGKILEYRAEQIVIGVPVKVPDILSVQQHPAFCWIE